MTVVDTKFKYVFLKIHIEDCGVLLSQLSSLFVCFSECQTHLYRHDGPWYMTVWTSAPAQRADLNSSNHQSQHQPSFKLAHGLWRGREDLSQSAAAHHCEHLKYICQGEICHYNKESHVLKRNHAICAKQQLLWKQVETSGEGHIQSSPKFCSISCFKDTTIRWADWEWLKWDEWVTRNRSYRNN